MHSRRQRVEESVSGASFLSIGVRKLECIDTARVDCASSRYYPNMGFALHCAHDQVSHAWRATRGGTETPSRTTSREGASGADFARRSLRPQPGADTCTTERRCERHRVTWNMLPALSLGAISKNCSAFGRTLIQEDLRGSPLGLSFQKVEFRFPFSGTFGYDRTP